MRTKLQVAMDVVSPEELMRLTGEIKNYVDILELGTPYLLKYGTEVIEEIKKEAPGLEILCDTKIMDAGYYEANEIFQRGADYVTVLAAADNATVEECVKAARENGKKVMADMICVMDFESQIRRLEELGVNILAVHTGVDQQALGRTPLGDLIELKKRCKKSGVAVAGGITVDTVESYLQNAPDILIVGNGIVNAQEPIKQAQYFYQSINR